MNIYSIIPLLSENENEIIEDIAAQHAGGVADCFLFSMTLAPKGTPPLDLAGGLCARYRRFKAALDARRIPNGVLIQASIGHEYYQNSTRDFQHFVNLTDGQTTNTCCPLDEAFLSYIERAAAAIAGEHPSLVMLDDDFRLMAARRGKACACPLHMKALNALLGADYTREAAWAQIERGGAEGARVRDALIETQRVSLVNAAARIRRAINAIDPSIEGAYCACGDSAEFAAEIASILARKGQRPIIRINNGNYCADSVHRLSRISFRAALQANYLRASGALVLAETDTCPHNRYSTSASMLHTHFVLSILEGAQGAKQWIMRLTHYEPSSGAAYRKILSENSGLYRALIELIPHAKWQGCRIPLPARTLYSFGGEYSDGWFACALERLGLPLFFSAVPGGAAFLDDFDDRVFTDEQLKALFDGGAVLSARAAETLNRRGLQAFTGVDVVPWRGDAPEYEKTAGGAQMENQAELSALIPCAETTRADTFVCNFSEHNRETVLFPGSVVFENPRGTRTVVFAGTPNAPFRFGPVFSFLNETRKAQLVRLLNEMGCLPAYYPGDAEVYFRCAKLDSGEFLCVFINLGADPLDEIELVCQSAVASVSVLEADGAFASRPFRREGKTLHIADKAVLLCPVLMKLSLE